MIKWVHKEAGSVPVVTEQAELMPNAKWPEVSGLTAYFFAYIIIMSRTFRVSAVNSEGNESELSDPVGIVVTPSNEVSE